MSLPSCVCPEKGLLPGFHFSVLCWSVSALIEGTAERALRSPSCGSLKVGRELEVRGFGNGSVAALTGGPRGASQPSVTQFQRLPHHHLASSGPAHVVHRHTCRQNTHTHSKSVSSRKLE